MERRGQSDPSPRQKSSSFFPNSRKDTTIEKTQILTMAKRIHSQPVAWPSCMDELALVSIPSNRKIFRCVNLMTGMPFKKLKSVPAAISKNRKKGVFFTA